MTNQLTIVDQHGELSTRLVQVGQAANEAAARSAFADYRSRKAPNTLTRQDGALTLFSEYLAETTGGDAPAGEALSSTPGAWEGVTWGLVEGFIRWLLLRGYAVGSVNVRLSTVKTYAKLAAKAGALDAQALALIRTVSGYSRKEGKHIDERREAADIPTRNGHKKAESIVLTPDQVAALKAHPATPRGRRDRLLSCLLLDHGLRVGEVAGLTVANFDLKAGELRFYRPKVDKVQTHKLTADTLQAARNWFEHDAPPIGPLLRASVSKNAGKVAWKAGELSHAGLTARAITARVRYLGRKALGLDSLSAHDLRHTWATLAARHATPLDRLQDAGGWASLAMPMRYIEAARIANEGVVLG